MAMVMSFTRIVSLSDRRFSSHPDAGTAALGTLKSNWSICNFALIFLVIEFVKDGLVRKISVKFFKLAIQVLNFLYLSSSGR